MGSAPFTDTESNRGTRLRVASGVELVQDADGVYELVLSHPVGSGCMRGRPLSRDLFVANVDFACERCPNVPEAPSVPLPAFSRGKWLTINLCHEGRCEVDVPSGGLATVSAGEVCISCSQERPAEFRYPSGRYRGVEVFVNTRIARSPLFSLLDDEDAVEAIARQAGSAAVLSGDGELNGHMRRIAALVEAPDRALATYEVLGLLLGLQRRDLSCARPRFILTRTQMRIVAAVHDELEGSLDCAHDARVLASAFGLSAATLNQYFSRAYGSTVAGYLRKRRMEVAAALLARGMRVAEAAVCVGYANPSKFSSAFKREYGTAPSEWRRRRFGEREGVHEVKGEF